MNLFGSSNVGLLTILMAIFVNYAGVSQSFHYKPVKHTYGKFIKPDIESFVNVKDYLPKGYVTDGSRDYTEYIQKAIDENQSVAFPNFPLKINDKGIVLHSNTKIFFNKKSKLILKPSSKGKYQMLYLNKIKNVILYNPKLTGDKGKHLGNSGQWGMGIHIQDSQNIKVFNPSIEKTFGDGIYITSYSIPTKNILIKYGIIDNVRRNGISIISGQNIVIDSIQIANVSGHLPSSGIDIEPNSKNNIISQIKLKNIYTYNNEKDGIIISLSSLVDYEKQKNVTIEILNHKDVGSRLGLFIPNLKKGVKFKKRLSGSITIENSEWLDTRAKNAINIRENTNYMPELILKNIRTNRMSKKEFKRRIDRMVNNKKHFKHIK